MLGNNKIHYVVSIDEPDGQPNHLSQRQRSYIGFVHPGNVPLCIYKLLSEKRERVSPDDFVQKSCDKGEMQAFLDCRIRVDGAE